MRLKLKIVYFFLWYFLKLKIVKNGVLWEWGFYFCFRFKRQFFGHTKLGDWRDVLFFVLINFGLKDVMEKCVDCFLVYLFWGLFLIKKV